MDRYIDSCGVGNSQVLVFRQRKGGGISQTLRATIFPKVRYQSLKRFPRIKSMTLFTIAPEDLIYE